MENNNRYEEVPKKENKAGKAFKGLGKYFKNVFGGFIDGFKYNNMKLASILVALPGLIIGFFLVAHASTINQMTFEYSKYLEEYDYLLTGKFPGMPFDGTAIAIFALMLFGILNVFNALSMSSKKNLGSVVISTVFTVIMLALSAYYIYAVFYFKTIAVETAADAQAIINNGGSVGIYIGTIVDSEGYTDEVNQWIYIVVPNYQTFLNNYPVSIGSIIVCDIFSVVGVVLGFINYDRTYEKVDR